MSLRVMIVEDSPITRIMIKEMIEGFGHCVVAETECLEEALAAYQKFKPDLVTVDLSLPKEDGLTILKALRQADPQAKVIIVSGNSQEKIRQEILKAGALALLNKPIEIEALQAQLDKITSP